MKRLWITYAWKDNSDGDFDYITQELRSAGIECLYDKISLIPGRRLWDQIGERITDSTLDAWSYLLTEHSVESEPCKEELAYAVDRALSSKDRIFPIIGLVHNISFDAVPLPLRTRLCVNLKDPNWVSKVVAGVNATAPELEIKNIPKFVINIHKIGADFGFELRPRVEERRYWRICVPVSRTVKIFGIGAKGYFNIGPITTYGVEGKVTINSIEYKFVGCADAINSITSAFVLIEGAIPSSMAFGFANEPFGIPNEWNPVRIEAKG